MCGVSETIRSLAFGCLELILLPLLPFTGRLVGVVEPAHLFDRILDVDRIIRDQVTDAAGGAVLVVATRRVEPIDVVVGAAVGAVGLDDFWGVIPIVCWVMIRATVTAE